VIKTAPWLFGSGKSATPWERIQPENATTPTPEKMTAPARGRGPAEPLREGADVLAADALPPFVVPRLATEGALAPPPQPATSSARPANAAGGALRRTWPIGVALTRCP
jgi:hypothetical protein